jgi:hypothetical protein
VISPIIPDNEVAAL